MPLEGDTTDRIRNRLLGLERSRVLGLERAPVQFQDEFRIRRTDFFTGEDGRMLRGVAWSCSLSVPTTPSGLVVTAARPVSRSLYTFSNSASLCSPDVASTVVSSHILRASSNFRHLLLFLLLPFFFFKRGVLQILSRCSCCHARLMDEERNDGPELVCASTARGRCWTVKV